MKLWQFGLSGRDIDPRHSKRCDGEPVYLSHQNTAAKQLCTQLSCIAISHHSQHITSRCPSRDAT